MAGPQCQHQQPLCSDPPPLLGVAAAHLTIVHVET
jgi:hypothetical protein